MASPWQQWMPFHIDRWKGSLHVQGMPSAAKLGYLYLLAAMWQSDDCTIPEDDYELQILSGLLYEEWDRLKALILRRFKKHDDGKLTNAVLLKEWEQTRKSWEAKKLTPEEREELRQKRSEAGKRGNEKRWGSQTDRKLRHKGRKPSQVATEPSQNDRLTEQNSTGEDLKPSRVSAASDPRHVLFRHVCKDYAAFKEVSFVWDGSEAKALDLLLKAAPDLTVDAFKRCIWHRAKSAGVTHGDRPRLWLPNITKYQQGPLNEFGKTGDAHGTGKTGKSIDAAQQAIAILAERRRDRAVAGEAGSTAAGEAGHRGLLGAGGGPDEVRPAGH